MNLKAKKIITYRKGKGIKLWKGYESVWFFYTRERRFVDLDVSFEDNELVAAYATTTLKPFIFLFFIHLSFLLYLG